jgi:DNA-binding transcriptional LysR family regulator
VNSYVETNSSEVVRELALNGVGVALRSLWDVGGDLAAGRLVRVLNDYEGSSGNGIYAVYPRSPYVPANVTVFSEFLKTLYAPNAPWEQPEDQT